MEVILPQGGEVFSWEQPLDLGSGLSGTRPPSPLFWILTSGHSDLWMDQLLVFLPKGWQTSLLGLVMQSGSGHHVWGKADVGAGPGQWVTVIKGLETKANAGLGGSAWPTVSSREALWCWRQHPAASSLPRGARQGNAWFVLRSRQNSDQEPLPLRTQNGLLREGSETFCLDP